MSAAVRHIGGSPLGTCGRSWVPLGLCPLSQHHAGRRHRGEIFPNFLKHKSNKSMNAANLTKITGLERGAVVTINV